MQEPADRMVMDRTTLSRALRLLERDGLLAVMPGRDARTRILQLTETGPYLPERARPHWDRAQTELKTHFGAVTLVLRAMLTHLVQQTA